MAIHVVALPNKGSDIRLPSTPTLTPTPQLYMCTVTYISPAPGQFILTSNRDEAPSRGATRLAVEERNGKKIIFPQDPAAGGTWIAAANNQRMVCLLNGAFEAHNRQTPYRLSRGIMVLESFTFPSATAFFQTLQL